VFAAASVPANAGLDEAGATRSVAAGAACALSARSTEAAVGVEMLVPLWKQESDESVLDSPVCCDSTLSMRAVGSTGRAVEARVGRLGYPAAPNRRCAFT
jgi:hypothetical protein